MDVNPVPTLQTPFTMIVSGPTGCGKTRFLIQLLKEIDTLVSQPVEQIIYVYGIVNADLELISEIPKVTVQSTLPDCFDGRSSVLIFDDMFMENEKEISRYFTKMRHRNISTIYVTQSLFFDNKYMRVTSRNAHYIVLFKNPRDLASVAQLSRQMYPKGSRVLTESYTMATHKPYSYLFIDMKPTTPDALRLKTSIFENPTFFVDVHK